MDVFKPEKRSAIMRAVKDKNTKPEMLVRRLLHRAGYRYRLYNAALPGKPDLIFPSRRKVIFVHGCFWHQHPGCRHADRPTSNNEYWQAKLNRNIARDEKTLHALRERGWDALVVWECQLRDQAKLLEELRAFLG
ncbi:MAG TPA: very short patch repair endonuclease [Chthonomonadaceae bacterium]|jgi:DNA mismatch endonuclease (patch repair protein)|nr:very short patch repair endonuclease [Chthonomonadaceae bacterium]